MDGKFTFLCYVYLYLYLYLIVRMLAADENDFFVVSTHGIVPSLANAKKIKCFLLFARHETKQK